MTGKLGVGAYTAGQEVLDAIKKADAQLVLLCDTALEMAPDILAWKPTITIIGRIFCPDQWLGGDHEDAGLLGVRLAEVEVSRQPLVHIWTGYCERVSTGQWEAELYDTMEAMRTWKLHELGKKSCVLNIAVGNIEPKNFPLWFPKSLAVADYVGYHAYGHNGRNLMNDPNAIWYALRFRQFRQACFQVDMRCPPFILTESGTYYPWRGRHNEEEVIADFQWLGEQIKNDDQCLGTTAWLVGAANPIEFYGWEMVGTSILGAFGEWNRAQGGAMSRFKIGNKWFDSLIEQLPVREGAALYKRRSFSDIEEITIHHSGSDTYATTPMALATDMVQHEDPNRTKYPEIPYHIIIEPDGHITVCQPLDALTWHADGGEPRDGVGINNWRGIGIVLIGDFTYHPPSGPQLAALSELCPEIDFDMGKRLRRVRHSDVQATFCPGKTSRGADNWFEALFSEVSLPPPIDKMAQIRAHAQAIIDLTA